MKTIELSHMQLILEKKHLEIIKGQVVISIQPDRIIFNGLINETYVIIKNVTSPEDITFHCLDENGDTVLIKINNNFREIYLYPASGTGYKFFR